MLTISACVMLIQPGLSYGSVNSCSLHEKHCTSCHDRYFYKRPQSKISNYKMLKRQVTACTKSLGIQLSEDETEALTECVNRIGYNF